MSRNANRSGWALLAWALFWIVPATAQVERISLSNDGSQADSDSYQAVVSDDGQVIAFRSSASNLILGHTNEWSDIYLRDLTTSTTELVSLSPTGDPLDYGLNHRPDISDDGQRVVFSARYPTSSDRGRSTTVLYDRNLGTRTYLLENVTSGGNPTGPSRGRINPDLAGSGQFVAFDSWSTLDALFDVGARPLGDDNNATFDIFVHDITTTPTPQLERVSRDALGTEGNGDSIEPSISDTGQWIAFHSYADNLVVGDINGHEDVFVKDRSTAGIKLVSVNPSGFPGNDDSIQAALSGNGLFVAFRSRASDLVAGDTNGRWDIFVRDLTADTTERVSVSTTGMEGNNNSTDPDLSDDGRFVVFRSLASNLVDDDTNVRADIFVHDRSTGQTVLVSRPLTGESNGTSHEPAISGDGSWIVFESDATNLVANDTNGARDIFRVPNPLFSTRAGE
jgi:Tol biopolymer transport system component